MQSPWLQGLKGQSIKKLLEVIPGVELVNDNKQDEDPWKDWGVAKKRKSICKLKEIKIQNSCD